MRKCSLYGAAAWLLAAGAFAQTEGGSLNREMTIEKDFTPIVRDASKINVLPAVEPPAPRRTEVRFSDWTVPVVPEAWLPLLPAAVPEGVMPFYRKRGYADVALGNYWNGSAAAGYRFLDSDRDRLNVWFRHLSTHGRVRFVDGGGRTLQKRNDNVLHGDYRHVFNRVIWRIEGDYRLDRFNYYGRGISPFPGESDLVVRDLNRMQVVHQVDVVTGIASPEGSERRWAYSLRAGYHRYGNRLGVWYGEKGVAENRTEIRFELGAPAWKRQGFAVEGGLDNLIYVNGCGEGLRFLCPDNYSVLSLNPYYRIEGKGVSLRAGAVAQLSFGDGTFLRLAPDVRLCWEFARRFFLYSDLTGGKCLHTFASLSKGNVYVNPSQLPRNGYVPVEWTAGVRSNVLNCLWADVSGGLKCVVGELFDCVPAGGLLDETGAVAALLRPVAGYVNRDAFVWHAGAGVKYSYNGRVNVSLDWRHEIRKTDGPGGSGRMVLQSGRPDDRLTVRTEVVPVRPLSLYVNYFMGMGRGSLLGTENGFVRMRLDDIHELGAGAMYRFSDAVHVRVQFDNILNCRYDLYYGMPAQGFRFMAGAGVNF